MKKTLIALALTALPVVSMADVVLYGDIKGGVEVSKIKDVKGTTTNLVDYGSYIGFKGSEQLNGDLKAIWQVEQKVDIAGGAYGKNGTNGFGTRDSFVGLSGNFGTVKAGYQETPVKELSGKLDIWNYDSSAAGLGVFTRSNDSTNRYVAATYETPNFNGFGAKVYVSPSDNNNGDPDSTVYGASLSFGQETGFFADLAGTYVRGGDANAYGNDKYAGQGLAQLGYQDAKWLAGVGYQFSKNVDRVENFGFGLDSQAFVTRANEAVLTGAYNVDDALRLKATAAYGWGLKGIAANGGQEFKLGKGRYYQGIIGADYALSKRTVANAQIGYVQADVMTPAGLKRGETSTKVRGGTVSVGVSHKF
ncbi:porin [Neisseriaceae bacterium B1]